MDIISYSAGGKETNHTKGRGAASQHKVRNIVAAHTQNEHTHVFKDPLFKIRLVFRPNSREPHSCHVLGLELMSWGSPFLST